MSGSAFVAAPAKVNLYLRVLGRRPDGFHEIDTIFQAVDLEDEVRVTMGGDDVVLVTEGAELGPTEENLAYRAALRFSERVRHVRGITIEVKKRIPVGAGLGGGSSDAAAVLKCLTALTQLHAEDSRVLKTAAELGSDVPFFLQTGALAVGRGRGELLDPCPPLPEAHLVLVSPPVHVATAWAYRTLSNTSGGRAGGVVGDRVPPPGSWRDVVRAAQNDFQDLVAGAHPEVARSLAALRHAGAELSLMSGSGSSCFGLFRDHAAAESVAARLQDELGWPCRCLRTLRALPSPSRD